MERIDAEHRDEFEDQLLAPFAWEDPDKVDDSIVEQEMADFRQAMNMTGG